MKLKISRKRPKETWSRYRARITNNLHLHFPLGQGSTYGNTSYYLGIAEEMGTADIPSGPYHDERFAADDRRSKLRGSKSPREFSKELLKVTASLGIDPSEFSRDLNKSYICDRSKDPDFDWANLDKKVCEAIIKIYLAMRDLGYSHQDLCK